MVEPDDSLLQVTIVGSWCIDASEQMQEIPKQAISSNHQTAVHVLIFFCDINKVFLQDSATMPILHPKGIKESPLLFKVIPIFRSPQFIKYFKVIKAYS